MIIKLRPSDFSDFASGCPRCLWLKYRSEWREPLNLALYSVLASKEENFLHGKLTMDMVPELGPGTFRWKGEKVMSGPIAGLDTPHEVFVGGSFDNVAQLTDGTVAVVDCKTTSGKPGGVVDKYVMQLNAYAYAIENPADIDFVDEARDALRAGEGIGYFQKPTFREPRTVSRIGVKVFSFDDPFAGDGATFQVAMRGEYQEAPKNFTAFRRRCRDLIQIIALEEPPRPGGECRYCLSVEQYQDALG